MLTRPLLRVLIFLMLFMPSSIEAYSKSFIKFQEPTKQGNESFFIPAIRNGQFFKDAELRHYVFKIITPLCNQLKIDTKSINLYFCQNDSINAFASIDNIMCIFSATITQLHLESFVGIIAHELGHIFCHHIMQNIMMHEQIRKKLLQTQLLALGLGFIAGRDGAIVGAVTSSWMLQSSYLAHSRKHENQADDIAFSTLYNLDWPLSGLQRVYLGFWSKYQGLIDAAKQSQEYLLMADPYLLTHPIGYARITRLKQFLAKHPSKNSKLPKHFPLYYDMMRAKLIAYSIRNDNINKYLKKDYIGKDDVGNYKLGNIAKKYFNSILYMRIDKHQKALELAQEILKIAATKNDDILFFTKVHCANILFQMQKMKKFFNLYNDILKSISKYDSNHEIDLSFIWLLLNKKDNKCMTLAYKKLLNIRISDAHTGRALSYWKMRAMCHQYFKNTPWLSAVSAKIFYLQKKWSKSRAMLKKSKAIIEKMPQKTGKNSTYARLKVFLEDLESQLKGKKESLLKSR